MSICAVLTIFSLANIIPEKLITPIIGSWAMLITLIGLYISVVQWQKNRLETEFLKEQFRLVSDYLKHIQNNVNAGFQTVENNGKILIGRVTTFSPINMRELSEYKTDDRFVVIHFPKNLEVLELFNELNTEIIKNPFFPKELSSVLSKLSTRSFFLTNYGSDWYLDESIGADKQFVLMNGAIIDSVDKKPLRIRYKDGYLQISDVLKVYEEFNLALKAWLKRNHINLDLNLDN